MERETRVVSYSVQLTYTLVEIQMWYNLLQTLISAVQVLTVLMALMAEIYLELDVEYNQHHIIRMIQVLH